MTTRADALQAADRGAWPARDDDEAWDALREWAFQWACLLADGAESMRWLKAMEYLIAQNLPHQEFTAMRLEMLHDRIRGRKLVQSQLRWRFGYKAGRRPDLVRRDVRTFHREHRGDNPRPTGSRGIGVGGTPRI